MRGEVVNPKFLHYANITMLIFETIQLVRTMRKLFILTIFTFGILHPGKTMNIPSLSNPANGAAFNFDGGLFVGTVTGATGYEFQYDTTSNFNSMYLKSDTSSTTYITTKLLRKGKVYYWRARAFKSGDTSAWSAFRSFTVFNTLGLSQPATNTTGIIRYLLSNHAGYDTSIRYIYEADTTPLFNSPMYVTKTNSDRQFADTNLMGFGNVIYWRATALVPGVDTLSWSTTNKYTIQKTQNIYSNSAIVGPNFQIGWQTAGLASYELQIDTVATFNSVRLVTKYIASGVLVDSIRQAKFGNYYHYRVRAKFGNSFSSWSTVYNTRVTTFPNLGNPTAGGTQYDIKVVFSWNVYAGAKCQIQLYADSSYTTLLKDTITSSTNYTYPEYLTFNKKYAFKVRLLHETDTAIWQISWFKTYPGGTVLNSPANNATNADIRTRFSFSKPSWATSYFIEIDTGNAISEPHSPFYIRTNIFKVQGTSYYIDTTLRYGQKYSWQVTSVHETDTADPSSPIRTLTTKAVPVNNFPPNNFVGIGTYTGGSVNKFDGSTYIQWELDTSMLFNSPEYSSKTEAHIPDDFDPQYIYMDFPRDLLFHQKYYWRTRCISVVDTSKWSTVFNFTTTTDLYHLAPLDKSVNIPISTKLEWSIQGSPSDYTYQYQVTLDSTFANPITLSLPQGASAEKTIICNYGTTYFWRARAFHSRDTSPWSKPTRFTTVPIPQPGVPLLVSPANGAMNIPIATLTLTWSQAANATSYEVEVATDAGFSNIVASGNPTTTSVLFSNVQTNTRYYWHVRAKNQNVTSAYSNARWFQSVPGVGLVESTKNTTMAMYPNPANQVVQFDSEEKVGIEIFNAIGQIISKEVLDKGHSQIYVSAWKEGMYLVVVKTMNTTETIKLVINH